MGMIIKEEIIWKAAKRVCKKMRKKLSRFSTWDDCMDVAQIGVMEAVKRMDAKKWPENEEDQIRLLTSWGEWKAIDEARKGCEIDRPGRLSKTAIPFSALPTRALERAQTTHYSGRQTMPFYNAKWNVDTGGAAYEEHVLNDEIDFLMIEKMESVLNPKHRAIFKLWFLYGWSTEKIAQFMGTTKGMIYQDIGKIKKQLAPFKKELMSP